MEKYALDYSENIEVNGDVQNIRVRAAEKGLPVVLFLHGGPGVCDRHQIMKNHSALAEKYTLVCWDQRGSGKSYRKDIQKQKLSVKTYVDDAEAVIDILREMFGQDKIVIAGHSWGTRPAPRSRYAVRKRSPRTSRRACSSTAPKTRRNHTTSACARRSGSATKRR